MQLTYQDMLIQEIIKNNTLIDEKYVNDILENTYEDGYRKATQDILKTIIDFHCNLTKGSD